MNSKDLHDHYLSMMKDVDERLNNLYSKEKEQKFEEKLKENGLSRKDFLK